LNTSEANFFAALASLSQVYTQTDFTDWLQVDVQSILPHRVFIGGFGKVLDVGVSPLEIVSVNFPDAYLNHAQYAISRYGTYMMQRWLQTGEPQLYDLSFGAAGVPPDWLARFTASGLQNLAAHGVFDIDQEHVSYFSFHQMPAPPGEEHKHLLKLLIPHLHVALQRCCRHRATLAPDTLPPRKPLTNRENEVLSWICQGKTTGEIATILQTSSNTVKNQVQAILVKLRVNTRAQAAAKATQLGLVVHTRP
jgi:transcriptional regulator EpsA